MKQRILDAFVDYLNLPLWKQLIVSFLLGQILAWIVIWVLHS